MSQCESIKEQLKTKNIASNVSLRCFRGTEYYVLQVVNVSITRIAECLNVNCKKVYEIYTDTSFHKVIWVDKKELHKNNIENSDGTICFPDKWSIRDSNGCIRSVSDIARRLEHKGCGSDIYVKRENNDTDIILLVFGSHGGAPKIASALQIPINAVIDVSLSYLLDTTGTRMPMIILLNRIPPFEMPCVKLC